MSKQVLGRTLKCYLDILADREIRTYSDLAKLKKYKFTKSFDNDPLPTPSAFNLSRSQNLCSRSGRVSATRDDGKRRPIGEYWDALVAAVADLEITSDEIKYIVSERKRLGLQKEQIRVLHARAFASAISQFVSDEWLDDRELLKLRRLRRCLSQLGWAPGD